MVTMTERTSIKKPRGAETENNEKQDLFDVTFADLWRTAQQRRSAYISSWIARIFRQSRARTKSSDDIRAVPPLKHVNSPR
jgi:hypothetical protein